MKHRVPFKGIEFLLAQLKIRLLAARSSGRFMRPVSWKFLLLSFALIVLAQGVLLRSAGAPLLPQGPSREIALTGLSLWQTGNLGPERYAGLYKHLIEISRQDGRQYWQDVFAMGANGRLYPKHCVLLSVLSAPFYGVFGEFGLWVFGQLLLLLLLFSTYRICREIVSEQAARIVVCLAFVGTQTVWYSYGLHYDVLGVALVFVGFDLMRSYPLLGAVLPALSFFVRPVHALCLPFLLFARSGRSFGWYCRACVGLTLGVAIYAGGNYYLWGSPFLTSYDRVLHFKAGEGFVTNWPHYEFSLTILAADWWRKLFDLEIGLVFRNPTLLLLPFALLCRVGPERARFLIFCTTAGVLQILLVFSYGHWSATAAGNRFLFIPIFLLLLPCAVVIEALLARLQSSR